MKSDEGFIDRAVVAPVEHQDFGTAGDLPRQADGEAVGIGRSQGKLPVGQAESLLQFLCNKNRILRRQHQRDAAAHLFFHGLHGGEWRMAGHGAGVSQTQIHVAMAIHVIKMCAQGLADKGWESARPLAHPVHGHARQQRLSGTLEERLGLRAVVQEALLLALHERGYLDVINGSHAIWVRVYNGSGTRHSLRLCIVHSSQTSP